MKCNTLLTNKNSFRFVAPTIFVLILFVLFQNCSQTFSTPDKSTMSQLLASNGACQPSRGQFADGAETVAFSCGCPNAPDSNDWGAQNSDGCYHRVISTSNEPPLPPATVNEFCNENNQVIAFNCEPTCVHMVTGRTCQMTNNNTVESFPNGTNFVFRGSGNKFEVCDLATNVCHATEGQVWPGTNFLIDSQMNQLTSGAAIRGNMANPNGIEQPVNTIELELHTGDFFSKNPAVHLAIGPMSLLPYEINSAPYNGYAPYPRVGGIPIPYAIGNNIILGAVPCNNGLGAGDDRPGPSEGYRNDLTSLPNGIAIEHLLGPYSTNPATPANKTWCAVKTNENPTPLFTDNSIYRIRITVKQGFCSQPGICRWVSYTVEKLNGATYALVAQGGDDGKFPDRSAQGGNFGFKTLKNMDRLKFYIAHVFTKSDTEWSFQIKNLKVKALRSAP